MALGQKPSTWLCRRSDGSPCGPTAPHPGCSWKSSQIQEREVEVTLSFRCMESDLKGTEVGDLLARGKVKGITAEGIGHVVLDHDPRHGYICWSVET
jgi:hypothetical protein